VLCPGANTHDAPLLAPTLDTLARVEPLPQQPKVHLDRGDDSQDHRLLDERGMCGQIAAKSTPAPSQAGQRWPVEQPTRGRPVQEAGLEHRRCDLVIDMFVALAHAIITLRRLIRRGWTLYRWDARLLRRPEHSRRRPVVGGRYPPAGSQGRPHGLLPLLGV
jgi:hypothetical protein